MQNHSIVRDADIRGKTVRKTKETTVTQIRRMVTSWGVNKVVMENGHFGVFWGPGWQRFIL